MSGLPNEENNYDCVVDFNLEPQEEIQCSGPNMNHRMHHSHILAPPLNMPLMNTAHPHHYISSQIPPQMMALGSAVNHPQIPTTPPETPPGSSSSNGSLTPPHFQGMPQHILDDKSWNAPYIMNNRCTGHEPLDLRPTPMFIPEHIHEQQQDWFNRKYDHQRNLNGITIKSPQLQTLQPLGSPMSAYIDDNELLGLTVRDLNKKLHNMSKDAQQKLKQRRRTLKNRGYAQSCRHKRQSYRQALEGTNKKLQDDNHKLQREFEMLSEEHNRLWNSNETLKKELEKSRSATLLQNRTSSPRENFNHETPTHGGSTDQSFYGI